MSALAYLRDDFPHGTTARYVFGCRCAECRAAKLQVWRDRQRRIVEQAADVVPNGPPLAGTIMRAGKAYAAKLCPGTGGVPCVAGGKWLRTGGLLCHPCLTRATVWNGLVPADRARAHLLKLSELGVGKHAVAAACDVSHTIITNIRRGTKKRLRAQTERRILAVDAGAVSDGARVPAAATRKILGKLLRRGFTRLWISRQLGYAQTASVFQTLRRSDCVTARNAANIEKLWRRVVEQKIQPAPWRGYIDARPTVLKVRKLLEEGFSEQSLGKRLGVRVGHLLRGECPKTTQATADAVARLYRELMLGEAEERPTEDVAARRRLLEAYAEGVPVSELEARFRMSGDAINQVARRAGVRRPAGMEAANG